MSVKRRVEIYQDMMGGWRWRTKSSNGNIIAVSSESYQRKSSARDSFYKEYFEEMVFEVTGDSTRQVFRRSQATTV